MCDGSTAASRLSTTFYPIGCGAWYNTVGDDIRVAPLYMIGDGQEVFGTLDVLWPQEGTMPTYALVAMMMQLLCGTQHGHF